MQDQLPTNNIQPHQQWNIWYSLHHRDWAEWLHETSTSQSHPPSYIVQNRPIWNKMVGGTAIIFSANIKSKRVATSKAFEFIHVTIETRGKANVGLVLIYWPPQTKGLIKDLTDTLSVMVVKYSRFIILRVRLLHSCWQGHICKSKQTDKLISSHHLPP